ncbi:amiloride-sensitive sodium channel subunit delta [Pleurodeles waltl]|uniref:amiloride-sensitive sodium channel subunit delta n=1 Tax=Pleurodeles waltl TaxID=8319 RepID=UPI003709891A
MAAAKAEQEEGLIEFYDSFKDMFQFFCDNTTIHGSIRLACTSKNKMKTTFWVLLFFSSFVMLYSQMGNLTAQYWNYPVNINISMSTNHKVKIFPAVTICNMNPYRFDVVNKHLVELDHLARKALSDLYGFNATESIDSEPEVTALEELLGEGSGHFNSSFHLDDSIKLERLTSDGMKPALSGTISTRMGFQLCDASGRDCYYKSYWSGVDAMREWYLYHYINIMSQIPITLNITDDEDNQALVYSCQYNGRMCSEREYAIFHHAIHGRCYTFNNNQNEDFWKASKFGIKYGLSLIVRAEQKPPLPLLSSTGGLRVIIHKHNQPVIVEHGGFNIMPGTETSISIQKDDMNWLGEPYGRCTEDGTDVDIKLLNSNAYTLQACVHSCFQYNMIQLCGCGYYFYPLPPAAEYCNYNKHPGWGHCFYKLHEKLMGHQLDCFRRCPKDCHETWYELSAGTARWPKSSSEEWIPRLLHLPEQYIGTSLRKDLSSINVFFQEISEKEINETAAMTVVDLLSRMGSLWGLWFGSSVLSVAELLELVLDAVALCIIMAYRLWHPRRPAAATCNCVRAVTPIKDVSKGICRCGSQSVEVSLPDIFPTGTRLRREHFPECTLHHGISVH